MWNVLLFSYRSKQNVRRVKFTSFRHKLTEAAEHAEGNTQHI